jgi:hypothetical protein
VQQAAAALEAAVAAKSESGRAAARLQAESKAAAAAGRCEAERRAKSMFKGRVWY